MTESSPIFTKTFMLMVWLLNHTGRFPKSERFRLAKRIDDSLFDFNESLLSLVYCPNKLELFYRADVDLARLRTYVRLSQEIGLTSVRQYEYFSGVITEIGKLLGGWKKTMPTGVS